MGLKLSKLIIPTCISLVFLFDGCAALKKRKHEPQLLESAAVTDGVDSALAIPSFVSGDWPAHNWWTLFGDNQLSEMMEAAIENNPDLMAAIARVCASAEEANKVRSAFLPHADAGFSYDYEHLSKSSLFRFPPSAIPAVVEQISLGLNFEYEIDLFGKNRNRYRAALGETRAKAAEMAESLLIITVSLAEGYFNYAANRLNLQLSSDLVTTYEALLELTKLRYINGLDSQIDVDQISADLLTAKESVAIYEKEVTLNVSQLNILMGNGPEEKKDFEVPVAQFDRPFPLPTDIPMNLLSRRPDLMAQVWLVEAAAHSINAAKAAFFPNINLTAFVGAQSLQWNVLFDKSGFAASLAPAINLPLFTGGRLTAQLNENYALYDEAVFTYNSLLLNAAKEVVDQIKILETKMEEWELQQGVLEKVSEIAELTNQRYENGVDNYFAVLDRNIDVLKQKMKEVKIQNERYLATLHLIKALGGGYGADRG